MAVEKIRIALECGHASMLRVRTTPEGYTHDWEVFVRGVDNVDISHYIEKVVFHLHETFPKPKRILKEPPYIVKESGYAGFLMPIYICLKNKDEPKSIHIQYDLTFPDSGPDINNVIRHTEIFSNPAVDFRKKLLKGGGIILSNIDEGHDRSESKSSIAMVGKPKLSGSDSKRHRTEPKSTNEFALLFGQPIKTAKISPENNKKAPTDKAYHKIPLEKSEKPEKVNKSKHSPHKDSKRDKNGEEKKDKKNKDTSKNKERSKDKNKRPPSPVSKSSSHQSPSTKRPASPLPVKKHQQLSPLDSMTTSKSTSPKIREKDHKKVVSDKEKDRDKDKFKDGLKGSVDEIKNDKKKKKHKDDKDSREYKDKNRDKERDKIKELKSSDNKNRAVEKSEKHEKSDRDKSIADNNSKSTKDIKKSPKPIKETSSGVGGSDRSSSKSRSEKVEVTEKVKDARSDKDRQKHKHKKKEKKERLDESREREKRDKRDKQKSNFEKDGSGGGGNGGRSGGGSGGGSSGGGSSASNSIVQSNSLSTHLSDVLDRDSSDSANSADEDDSKPITNIKTETELTRNSSTSASASVSASDSNNRPSRSLSPGSTEHAKRERTDKMKKEKLKSLRNEERDSNKKRKRRSGSKGDDEIPMKREKNTSFSPPLEPVSSSQSPVTVELASAYSNVKTETDDVDVVVHQKQDFEAESEQIAPDSTNSALIESENDEPLVFSEDYVSQLKDLQQKIMTLQDNQELQRVVQVIAATGQYEITRKTFDFDLCALDRRTVQRLQQFFSAS